MRRVPSSLPLPYAISLSGGVGGLHETKSVTVPEVDIGGYSFNNVPADLGSRPDGPYKGRANVGIQMFKPFHADARPRHDRLWLKPIGGVPVFSKDRAGMFVHARRRPFQRPACDAGKSGRAGWPEEGRQAGRRRRRAGRPGFLHVQQAGWSRVAAGTKVAVTKSDGADRYSDPRRLLLMLKRRSACQRGGRLVNASAQPASGCTMRTDTQARHRLRRRRLHRPLRLRSAARRPASGSASPTAPSAPRLLPPAAGPGRPVRLRPRPTSATPDSVARAVEGANAVDQPGRRRSRACTRSMSTGAGNLAEAAPRRRVPRPSSISARSAPMPTASRVYGRTKGEGEQRCAPLSRTRRSSGRRSCSGRRTSSPTASRLARFPFLAGDRAEDAASSRSMSATLPRRSRRLRSIPSAMAARPMRSAGPR